MRVFQVTLFVLAALASSEARKRTTTTAASTDTTTTTTAATTDDEYTTNVKALIDAGTVNGNCAAVESSSVCETDLTGENLQTTSYVNTFEYGGYRVLISSGIPDHTAETDAEKPNPNLRCERWQYVTLPIRTSSDVPDTSLQNAHNMGAVGWAFSGGVLYDHRSAPDGSTAWYNEGTSLDSCSGHSTAFSEYHYHLNLFCYGSASNATACEQVGYMTDGYPVYGYCAVDGVTLKSCFTLNDGEDGSNDSMYTYAKTDSCHLDECNGYTFSDGSYGYVLTEDYPYVPRCYNGDVQVTACDYASAI